MMWMNEGMDEAKDSLVFNRKSRPSCTLLGECYPFGRRGFCHKDTLCCEIKCSFCQRPYCVLKLLSRVEVATRVFWGSPTIGPSCAKMRSRHTYGNDCRLRVPAGWGSRRALCKLGHTVLHDGLYNNVSSTLIILRVCPCM